MSYSRWSNSRWYTFWSDSNSIEKEKEEFTICEITDDIVFTYKEIVSDINKCLSRVKSTLKCNESELQELKTYMKRFKMDVDDEYKGNS